MTSDKCSKNTSIIYNAKSDKLNDCSNFSLYFVIQKVENRRSISFVSTFSIDFDLEVKYGIVFNDLPSLNGAVMAAPYISTVKIELSTTNAQ